MRPPRRVRLTVGRALPVVPVAVPALGPVECLGRLGHIRQRGQAHPVAPAVERQPHRLLRLGPADERSVGTGAVVPASAARALRSRRADVKANSTQAEACRSASKRS